MTAARRVARPRPRLWSGHKVAALLRQRGLTASDLARDVRQHLGVVASREINADRVDRWLDRSEIPDADEMMAIMRLLGVTHEQVTAEGPRL